MMTRPTHTPQTSSQQRLVAQALRHRRLALGLTLQDLARQLDVSRQRIHQIETATKNSHGPTVKRLAQILSVDLNLYPRQPYLFGSWTAYKRFIATLKRLRQERRISLRDLSECSGVNFASLCATECGESVPHLQTVKRLAHALNVPLCELLRIPTPIREAG